jgi:hypothetical protein
MSDIIANRSSSTHQVVADAIKLSIERDDVVVVECTTKAAFVALSEALFAECDDQSIEFNGTNLDGEAWRVQIWLSQS